MAKEGNGGIWLSGMNENIGSGEISGLVLLHCVVAEFSAETASPLSDLAPFSLDFGDGFALCHARADKCVWVQ